MWLTWTCFIWCDWIGKCLSRFHINAVDGVWVMAYWKVIRQVNSCKSLVKNLYCFYATLRNKHACFQHECTTRNQWVCLQWTRITFRKRFQNVIRPFSWLESLILAHVNKKAVSNQAFGTRFETRKKGAFWIVIRLESLILVHVNAKLFRNVIRACAY